jgi:valyl-tRNA synthetase
MVATLEQAINDFDINKYSKTLYYFIWNEFCDSYVEIVKNRLAKGTDLHKNMALAKYAVGIFERTMCYLHPVMPFISEEIWQTLQHRGANETIMHASLDDAAQAYVADSTVAPQMNFILEAVERVRQMRKENNVPPGEALAASVRIPASIRDATFAFLSPQWMEANKHYIEDLCRVTISVNGAVPLIKASSVVREAEIFVSLEGLIDLDNERDRLQKEIARLTGQCASTETKLANPNFADRAPKDVVEKERAKLASFQDAIGKLQESLKVLG